MDRTARIYAHPTLMQNRHSLAQLTREFGLVVVARFSQKSLNKRSTYIKPSSISLDPIDPFPGPDAA